jgi:hypothetical protein
MAVKRVLVAVLILLLAGTVAFAVLSSMARVNADRAWRDVLILTDWHGLHSLAPPDGELPLAVADSAAWELLTDLPGAYLCYSEETIETLTGQGILAPAWVASGAPAYMVTAQRYEDDIRAGARRHGYLASASPATDNRLVIQFPDLEPDDLRFLPVAWLSEVTAAAADAGVPVILRPGGTEYMGADGIRRTLNYAAEQPLVLFSGPQVLGYPGQAETVATLLDNQGQHFGWIEFDKQDGSAQLASAAQPEVTRIHSIPPDELVNYDIDGAVARFLRAVRERNIRGVYLRPFTGGRVLGWQDTTGFREQLLDINERYFTRVSNGLTEAGYRIAPEPTLPPAPPRWVEVWRGPVAVVAAGAAWVCLLLMWFPGWPRSITAVLVAATALAGVGALFIQQLAAAGQFALAVAAPLLGFWLALWLYQTLAARRAGWHPLRLLVAVLALLVASAVAALGGLIIHATMWDVAALTKVTQFRGVTLSLGLPLLFVAAYAWQAETLQQAFIRARLELESFASRFGTLWQSPIRYGDVAFILIAMAALAVVLLRSGNDSLLGVLNAEVLFREQLEQWFSVRPRTKELLGHPLLVLFFLSLPWRNRLSVLLALAGILGQVSILNTFCHLHTPLLLTVQRVLLGLGLGVLSAVPWGVVLLIAAGLRRVRPPAGEHADTATAD